jgi:hypothetical protein
LQITIVTNGNGLNQNILRDWQITVNQLDCPLGQSRSIANIMPDEINPTQIFEKPARLPRGLVSDFLAPPGCLQYYPEPEGIIDSFNFNNGQGVDSDYMKLC